MRDENGQEQQIEAIANGDAATRLVPQVKTDIDIQISTAQAYPRSIKRFQNEAMSMATIDEETAASCFYVLPRGGKNIEGPSVRLAEMVVNSWRNIRFGSTYIGETEDRKSVIAEGFAYDLEKNVACKIQVTRRIVDKYGKRYRDDIVEVTKLAASSIALRNAIFKVIPMVFVNQIYNAAKRLAVGDATSLNDRRHKMVDHFAKFGVNQERLLGRIGKPSIEDIGLEDIEMLIGLATAIKDGEVTVDAAFPKPEEANGNGNKPTTLAGKVKAKAEAEAKKEGKK